MKAQLHGAEKNQKQINGGAGIQSEPCRIKDMWTHNY